MSWQQFFEVCAWVCGVCSLLSLSDDLTWEDHLLRNATITATLVFLTALFGGLAAGLK